MALWGASLAAVLVGLLAALLLLPLRLEARAAGALRLRLRLFGGLVRVTLFDSARKKPPRRVEPDKPARKKRGWRPSGAFVRALPRAGIEALGKIRIDEAWGELRVGLGDPALTGEFYGRAMGVMVATPLRGRLRLVPLFDRQALEGEGALVLSLVPARLLPVAARFLWRLR